MSVKLGPNTYRSLRALAALNIVQFAHRGASVGLPSSVAHSPESQTARPLTLDL